MKSHLKSLASLKLTVALLAVSMLLVFAGTLAQIDMGIWQVQKKYFHSLWVWVEFQVFLPRPEAGAEPTPGGFPLPGGYLIGALMLVNLLAAHSLRFKLTPRRSGIIMIHLGLILLLLGELATSLFAVESQMTIDEGQTVAFSQDIRSAELAVVDPSAPDSDSVVAFPESALVPAAKLRHSLVPFEITVHEYEANSQLLGPRQAPPDAVSKATAGFGQGVILKPLPRTAGTDGGTDMASAHVTLMADGKLIGIYLLSFHFDQPQPVVVNGKTWLIALRFERYYKPYTMHLIDFSHDRYLGTDTPKNFSSRLRLVDPANNVDREVLIRMNEPLRYAGETYYQSSFKPGDKTTILQVVRNPAWTMPYIACTVGGVGMLVHFGILLVGFLKKRTGRARAAAMTAGMPERLTLRSLAFPLTVLALSLFSVLWALKPPPSAGPEQFDYAGFGNLPVTHDGRVLPIDTLARTSLQAISGRQTTKIPAAETAASDWNKVPPDQWKSVSATQWLADVFSGTERSAGYRVFRIDHPGVLGMLGLEPDRSPRLYSFLEILEQKEKLQEQIELISEVDDKKRDAFQRKVADLHQRLQIFLRLADLASLYLVPPVAPGEEWQQLGHFAPSRTGPPPPPHPAAEAILRILASYHENKPAEFNKEVATYRDLIAGKIPSETGMARYEAFFNRFDPFYRAQILYVVVFLLGCVSWLVWSKPLGRAAYLLLFLCLLVHTFGMVSRIAISGRPPVTNLYSSAVFIAWGGVLLAAILEFFFRNMIATVTSAAMGFTSLLIAHRLAGDGDTMRMMQAVLDTNFWLATHVVVITLGYAATFLAGILAIAYVVLGLFTRHLTASRPGRTEEDAPAALLPRMVYAILCFAMLFSFVGTVLGGIWADQSWGRFWGWDPKENGAVLIVIWNALILHARMAGFARDRGVMLLAIFGNIVTSWSWFGTNMLGVGLHSYGFMESALFWLLMFVASQLVLIALGNLPLRLWRSFRDAAPPRPAA
ncbi:MAG: cytochrome c biogenesis protein CcsA [Planctomycetota bacterium]